MDQVTNTELWKTTLGIEDSKYQSAINRLRNSFIDFRDKATILAAEIARDLPDFTVHDITHIDALWEMADCILGPDYKLNPAEAFVLGGAFLLHDLGMTLSAYPKGIAEIEKLELWKSTALYEAKKNGLNELDAFEFSKLPESIRTNVLSTVLRKLHAATAERIATTSWRSRSDNSQIFLIDNIETRQSFGRIIGKIAHSHWWKISRVEDEFARVLGAPAWCPREWTIDPLKIASILRTADAAHIDSRRAPIFLRALRSLNPSSDIHWSFQEKLQKPYLSEDCLFYTSGYAFSSEDAPSWWLCFDALNLIDKELRETDALLADRHLQRFKAKRVFGVESPERLSSLIQTDGWHPIDAFIHIGDLPKIIKTLGGEELYGRDYTVPIREMIQNSSDALRARILLENRTEDWGQISISYSEEENKKWIEVKDNGIGMSLEVIKSYLFEFGSSYWDSDLLLEEYPSLSGKKLNQTGKYGIGFFSLFMLGNEVKIITRKSNESQKETYVVEFYNGLHARPIIRQATSKEQLIEGGTQIKLTLDADINLLNSHRGGKIHLHKLVASIAPALDCCISIKENEIEHVFPPNHWLTCSNADFINWMILISRYSYKKFDESVLSKFYDDAAHNLTFLKSEDGELIGRAFLSLPEMSSNEKSPGISGVVCVGGLAESSTAAISGILKGKTNKAARDSADHIVPKLILSAWASQQSKLAKNLYQDEKSQLDIAQCVRILKGDVNDLPIVRSIDRYYSIEEFRGVVKEKTNIIIAGDFALNHTLKDYMDFEIHEGVYFSGISGVPSLFHNRGPGHWGGGSSERWAYDNTCLGYIMDLISAEWNIEINELINHVAKQDSRKELSVGSVGGNDIKEHGYCFERTQT